VGMGKRTACIVLVTVSVLASEPASAALARKGAGGGNPKQVAAPALSPASEQSWSSFNPAAPSWCLNEDDWHHREWSGSLNGSLTVFERLCDANVDYSGGLWWSAGGIGLQADLVATGTLGDLAITSPQGDVHHAELVGSTTSKGQTINHYAVCYVPGYSLAYNVGGQPLPGGLWQITWSGGITTVPYTNYLSYHGGFSVTGEMTDAPFQQQHCPVSEQNLN
jgi:hypothetical protein